MISFPLWPPASATGDYVFLSNEAQHWCWKPPMSGVQPACLQGSRARAPAWEPCASCVCFQEVKGWVFHGDGTHLETEKPAGLFSFRSISFLKCTLTF